MSVGGPGNTESINAMVTMPFKGEGNVSFTESVISIGVRAKAEPIKIFMISLLCVVIIISIIASISILIWAGLIVLILIGVVFGGGAITFGTFYYIINWAWTIPKNEIIHYSSIKRISNPLGELELEYEKPNRGKMMFKMSVHPPYAGQLQQIVQRRLKGSRSVGSVSASHSLSQAPVYGPPPGHKPAPAYVPPGARKAAAPQIQESHKCERCGDKLVYLPDRRRWYCERCRRYKVN